MTDKHVHFALLTVGAAVVLYILFKASQAQQAAPPLAESAPAAAPAYPNTMPLPAPGDINIGGSPVNITYNMGAPWEADSQVELSPGNSSTPGGSCNCDNDPCDQAVGIPVTVQKVPQHVFTGAVDNFSGFLKKTAVPAQNTPAAAPAPAGGGAGLFFKAS